MKTKDGCLQYRLAVVLLDVRRAMQAALGTKDQALWKAAEAAVMLCVRSDSFREALTYRNSGEPRSLQITPKSQPVAQKSPTKPRSMRYRKDMMLAYLRLIGP